MWHCKLIKSSFDFLIIPVGAVPTEQDSTLVADKTHDEPSTSAAPPPDMTMMSMRRGSVSSSDGGDYGGDLFGGDYDDDYDIPSVAPQSVQRPVLQADEEDEDVSTDL